jgi:hypothetical protein
VINLLSTVSPEVAFASARHISVGGAALGQLAQHALERLHPLATARPWGSDEIGQACQRTYDQLAPAVLAAWPEIASYVESLGTQVMSATRAAVDADTAAAIDLADAR